MQNAASSCWISNSFSIHPIGSALRCAETERAITIKLYEKVAVVTGGAGGIGTAICQRFLAEGAVVYAIDLQPPTTAIQECSEFHFLQADITSESSVAEALSKVEAEQGLLHVLVNAAGIEIEKTIVDTSLSDWNRIFAVNVTGAFLMCKYAIPIMEIAASTGISSSIINFGSYDGFIADPGLAAYCASKGAVHALTRALATDHGPDGIRVNAICPGYIDTPMLQSFFNGHGSGGNGRDIAQLKQAVEDVHPIRRYGTPTDIANLVNWLASDEAAYASGQLWVLDGGLTAQAQQMRL